MTEAEHKADFAWERMYDYSLPPGIALDMVQDITGERDAALKELLAASLRWFVARLPNGNYRQRKLKEAAAKLLELLLKRDWRGAGVHRRQAAIYCTANIPRATGGGIWDDWLHAGKRLIYLCGELEKAADPARESA